MKETYSYPIADRTLFTKPCSMFLARWDIIGIQREAEDNEAARPAGTVLTLNQGAEHDVFVVTITAALPIEYGFPNTEGQMKADRVDSKAFEIIIRQHHRRLIAP